MLVRDAIQLRSASADDAPGEVAVRLPLSLKSDASPAVWVSLLRRLAASRTFALGDRAGVLRRAQARSGRAFRLDVRQRVIVKGRVARHVGRSAERAAALRSHLGYLGRSGAGRDGEPPVFFDREEEGLVASVSVAGWGGDRHHFRFIISPEHGDRIDDLPAYVRDVMALVGADLGEPDLLWIATCHYDTDQPHAHVLVRGRRPDGRDLVIRRDYMAYGLRARAQEMAQQRLGDLSRVEAERRIWRETEADRFTGFDRRLLEAADSEGLVADGVGGTDAWAALTRGRLRRLEQLGLAVRVGRRYRLDGDLESRLRSLQTRRDIVRTLNQRRMQSGRDVRVMDPGRVRGVVVEAGAHDRDGAAGWVIVRDSGGLEHYARVGPGQRSPEVGRTTELVKGSDGLATVSRPRRLEL